MEKLAARVGVLISRRGCWWETILRAFVFLLKGAAWDGKWVNTIEGVG